MRYKQILTNLVSNAHKYTRKGYVIIRMNYENDRNMLIT